MFGDVWGFFDARSFIELKMLAEMFVVRDRIYFFRFVAAIQWLLVKTPLWIKNAATLPKSAPTCESEV